mmetsp:Transcript_100933/g.289747  ORF Transcript_100933/g.289747 Transcript_100933/m.289747 type:complete len:140 (-) Transcript_100933:887-1306(-)
MSARARTTRWSSGSGRWFETTSAWSSARVSSSSRRARRASRPRASRCCRATTGTFENCGLTLPRLLAPLMLPTPTTPLTPPTPLSRLSTINSISKSVSIFPRAHTCFNRIDLPLYDSKKELKKFLTMAIQMEATGFDID